MLDVLVSQRKEKLMPGIGRLTNVKSGGVELEYCTDIVKCDLCRKRHREGVMVKPKKEDWLFIGTPCMRNLAKAWEEYRVG